MSVGIASTITLTVWVNGQRYATVSQSVGRPGYKAIYAHHAHVAVTILLSKILCSTYYMCSSVTVQGLVLLSYDTPQFSAGPAAPLRASER